MKWPKIIAVMAAVILLYSGISIAGYLHLHSPVFKVDFQNIISFIGDTQPGVEDILRARVPAPVSAQIDQMVRLQTTVARSI